DILVPEWYANAVSELSKSTGLPTVQVSQEGPLMSSYIEDFEILDGDIQGLSDTMSFLKSMVELDEINGYER
ncbi:hypothetical protein LINPERHAP1_LOCUS44052, partial [Linum perenne]